jgi:hypothetical protein
LELHDRGDEDERSLAKDGAPAKRPTRNFSGVESSVKECAAELLATCATLVPQSRATRNADRRGSRTSVGNLFRYFRDPDGHLWEIN